MLPEKFKEPDGFQWGSFTNAKGAKIRYGSLQPEGEPKGTIVIVPGFREPIEKYFEVIRDMTAKGFAVWMMDWRGQGGSDRFVKSNPQKMHNEGYEEHISSLHQFADKVVSKTEGPLILMAHSMGAHIGLRYLKEHEGVFESAILTAPMLDIMTGLFPKPMAKLVVRFAKAAGYLEKYIPGASDWSEEIDKADRRSRTSDPERGRLMEEIFNAMPELKAGDATYGWVYHAFASIAVLQDEAFLKSIKTPLLMQISGKETTLDKKASARAAGLLPNCTRIDVPEAFHEIWMERDELRQPWLEKVSSFLEERLKGRMHQPKKPEQNGAPPPKLG